MKYITLILLTLGLAACTPTTNDVTDSGKYHLPNGLIDCKVYELESSVGKRLTVFRCPNSSTGVASHGKHPNYSSTVEGSL